MMNFNLAIGLISILSLGGIWGVFVVFLLLSGVEVNGFGWPNESLSPSQILDTARATGTISALFGGIFAMLYSYRKQRISEAESLRSDASSLVERYRAACEQIGSENASVQLAGIYALSWLADEWVGHRQQCVDVLCAYLRLTGSANNMTSEVPVRTVLNLIESHTSVLNPEFTSWSDLTIDLTGASLPDFSWNQVKIQKLILDRAEFEEEVNLIFEFDNSSVSIRDVTIAANLFIASTGKGRISLMRSGVMSGAEVQISPSLETQLNCMAVRIEDDCLIRINLGASGTEGQIDFSHAHIIGRLSFFGDGREYETGTILLQDAITSGEGLVGFQKDLFFEADEGFYYVPVSSPDGTSYSKFRKITDRRRSVFRPDSQYLKNCKLATFEVSSIEPVPKWHGAELEPKSNA
ncbi:hypothetical protein [Corynebacterium callunae]|uniref:Pentapeptide repeat-containing protein n=1 Tax=Corynebacterium callunae DSM 20147 TaxID=1121353 RepID=M1UVM0_9CORY|nr:hypothetical protein [Corynebacterium callunae]AGG67527.1 hypothetical protein H924_10495 [Corynebacterium callunae DSM 20147]